MKYLGELKSLVSEAMRDIRNSKITDYADVSRYDERYKKLEEIESWLFEQTFDESIIADKALDELLAKIPVKSGYYLKLYKEISPNEFEFKVRIDHWEEWSDMEWEIVQIVKRNPKERWGSGKYRVIPFREGGFAWAQT